MRSQAKGDLDEEFSESSSDSEEEEESQDRRQVYWIYSCLHLPYGFCAVFKTFSRVWYWLIRVGKFEFKHLKQPINKLYLNTVNHQ